MTHSLSLRGHLFSLAAMLGLVVGNACLQVALGDLIADRDGLGYDGTLYAEFARDFPGRLEGEIPMERLQRLLPSAVVWVSFRALGIELAEDRTIIAAFRVLNAVCLAGCVLLWHPIANCLGLGQAGRWFGFVALFVNFAFGKWTWFYPVLTDAPTYLVAFLLCLAFLRRSLGGLALVTLIGSFVCSTLNIWSLPLFFFLTARPLAPSAPAWRWRVYAITGGIVLLCVVATLVSYFALDYRPMANETIFYLFPFSLLGMAVYLWWAFEPLVAWEPFVLPWKLPLALSAPGVLTWLVVNVLIKLVCEKLKAGGSVTTSEGVLGFVLYDGFSIFVRGTVAPLIFLVTHTMFLGPVVLVLMLRWRSVCRRLAERGPALPLFAGLLVLLALDSETRHFYVPVPFLVAFAAQDIEALRPRRAFWWVFVGFSVLWSTVWMAGYNLWMDLHGTYTVVSPEFYARWLNIGPWFGMDAYMLHREIAILAGLALAWSLWRAPRQGERRSVSPAVEDRIAALH